MFLYFSNNFWDSVKRQNIVSLKNSYKIAVGSVIKIFYSVKGSNFYFEGFCYSSKLKSFFLPDTGLKLITKVKDYLVTFSFGFFYNLIFSSEFLDYKKSSVTFRSSSVTKYRRKQIKS